MRNGDRCHVCQVPELHSEAVEVAEEVRQFVVFIAGAIARFGRHTRELLLRRPRWSAVSF